MANIFKTPEKVSMRDKLFEIGIHTLQQNGWRVERIPGIGKSSVRKITKGNKSLVASIRTSQDTWIAFPRNQEDNGWGTLCDVDVVVAVSVDHFDDPRFAQVHMIEADEMRERFDRAYAERKKAGRTITVGHGMWVPLYRPDEMEPVYHVGGGAGLKHPPIAKVPLEAESADAGEREEADSDDRPLTIAEAKRRLAMTLGVEPSSIKITVEA